MLDISLPALTDGGWFVVIAALVTGLCSVTTALVARQNKKLQEIHVLVNANLSAAIAERKVAVDALADLNARVAELVLQASKVAAEAAVEAVAKRNQQAASS